jgi:hypothetical protein
VPTDGAVGVSWVKEVGEEGEGNEDVLSGFFLDCSARRWRNSFCLASKEETPAGVMSAKAGERRKGVVVLKARIDVVRVELFASLRANIVILVPGVVLYCRMLGARSLFIKLG